MRPRVTHRARAALMGAVLVACARHPRPAPTPVSSLESAYLDLRTLRDSIDVARASGEVVDSIRIARYNAIRARVAARLDATDTAALDTADRRAVGVMRESLAQGLDTLDTKAAAGEAAPACEYDAARVGAQGETRLRSRIYDCYGRAAHHVVVDRDTLDRLTVLGLLARTDDPARRATLFRALAPVWRTVNGDDRVSSPYRTALRLTRNRSAAADAARSLGIDPDTATAWLIGILDHWRTATPDRDIEPWDFYYAAGDATRRLSPRIDRAALIPLTMRAYASLGAALDDSLHVHFDIDPRDGKTPVAFTTFGSRGRLTTERHWRRPEPWVFATYPIGGFDNLEELMHESGHAIHIAAIHTRPAFDDWPDSDPLTEAIGDIVALDVYEPRWQWRLLGDSVPTAAGLRAKYASIVFDVAWALFESRLLTHPDADPNAVWTDIMHHYLHITPHPEWSWWAMRGQLIDAPGYMMNYALGAIIAADLRGTIARRHGPYVAGDSTWYPWVSAELLRFGRGRPARDALTAMLERPLSPAALLADLDRLAR